MYCKLFSALTNVSQKISNFIMAISTFCTILYCVVKIFVDVQQAQRIRNPDHNPTQWWYKIDIRRHMSVIIDKPNFTRPIMEENERAGAPVVAAQPVKTSSFFTQKLEGLSWLLSASPGFPLNGDQISVIHEPSKFYDVLLQKCQTAQRRITIASLYLGTGKLEENLVSAIGESLQRQGDSLKVKVLLDYTRGSRGKNNSRQMLLPLMKQYEQSCQVSLYHTPALRGFLRNVQRYNELVGLQHMKLYIFDDSLIITGANLSDDYFTNRQDRYVQIEDCPPLADFYDGLVSRVAGFSLRLQTDDSVALHAGWSCHPTEGRREEFVEAAGGGVMAHFEEAARDEGRCVGGGDCDTWVFPLAQMGQLGVDIDSRVTTRLLESAEPDSTVDLATGYFNLTSSYVDSIVNRSAAKYNILMAHPNANGFLGAKGPAYGIPFGYTLIASGFSGQVRAADQQDRVSLLEYQRPGWTYHAKGLWYSLPGERLPSLTLVGSPNFGGRSVHRDLETQVAIVTRNTRLRQSLHEEKERLYKRATAFTEETARLPDRVPPLWTHWVVGLFRDVF